MFSRRIFLQGAAGALALLSSVAAGAAIAGADADDAVTIDCAETPLPAAARGRRHVHLSGSQLERYNRLKSLLASGEPVRVRARLDDTAGVLLAAALSEIGRAVGATVSEGGVSSFLVKAG